MLEALTIAALIIGPISAVQVQNWVAYYRERKARQLRIFTALMATREDRLSKEHVAALNLIEMNFSDTKKKEKPVIDAWKLLLRQLNNPPEDRASESETDSAYERAGERRDECVTNLLLAMSEFLGYGFKTIDIKDGWYIPMGHESEGQERETIREELVNLLTGKKSLNVNIQNLSEEETEEKGETEL